MFQVVDQGRGGEELDHDADRIEATEAFVRGANCFGGYVGANAEPAETCCG